MLLQDIIEDAARAMDLPLFGQHGTDAECSEEILAERNRVREMAWLCLSQVAFQDIWSYAQRASIALSRVSGAGKESEVTINGVNYANPDTCAKLVEKRIAEFQKKLAEAAGVQ